MIPFLFGYCISFCYFFLLEVVRGPDPCVKLKMFPGQFHIFGQMDKKNLKGEWNGAISAVDACN